MEVEEEETIIEMIMVATEEELEDLEIEKEVIEMVEAGNVSTAMELATLPETAPNVLFL